MNKLPIVIVNEIFKYLKIKELLTYRLVSRESKKIINRLFCIVKIGCNSLVNNLNMFSYIKYLDLQFCRQINDKMLKCLENIYCINLRGCSKITDKGLEYLRGIREINLAGCYKITDYGLKNLKHVTFIDISYCPNITGIGMAQWNGYPTVIMDNYPNNCAFLNINKENIYMLLKLKLIKIESTNNHPFLSNHNNITCKIYPIIKNKYNNFMDNEYNDNDNNNNCEYATTNQTRSVNKIRIELFDKVYKTDIIKRDKFFMKNYEKILPNPNLLDYKKAKERLYHNKNIAFFIKNLKLCKIDTLIGGSMGLYCVYKKANFIPGDLDLYIKEINKKKLLLLEDIIYKSFKINKIVVVRNPITMTWYINYYDSANSDIVNENIMTIQINLLNITSWAEVFITYHTDLTCIGYEVSSNKFIYLIDRWDNTFNSKIHYFTNILNLDFPSSLINACIKYKNRGFNCEAAIEINKKTSLHRLVIDIEMLMRKYYGITLGNSSGCQGSDSNQIPYNCLSNILYNKYYDVNNIDFASSVDYLFLNNEKPIDIKFLSLYKISILMKNKEINNEEIINTQKFLQMPDTLKQINGKFCNYYNEYYTVGIKCPKCNSIISLKSYLSWNKKPSGESYSRNHNDICKHLNNSRNPYDFDYKWYPELIMI